jgi:hypothetical protein
MMNRLESPGPILLFLLVTAAIATTDADARMYQWSHPSSGTVQLSGSPPPWYRSTVNGPRVFVFDNGRLVDDTAVSVAEEHRLALRASAFNTDVTPAPIAKLDATAREALPEDSYDTAAARVAVGADSGIRAGQAPAAPANLSVDDTVAELKSLLDAGDTQRLTEAKATVENTAAGPE